MRDGVSGSGERRAIDEAHAAAGNALKTSADGVSHKQKGWRDLSIWPMKPLQFFFGPLAHLRASRT